MIRRATLLGIAFVLLFPIAATAGIDVDPSKLRPKLFLKATRPDTHHGHAHPTISTQRTSSIARRYMCRVNDPLVPMFGCRTPDLKKPGAKADLTEGAILRAVREIGLPSLKVRIQPGTATLVNIPTIFYTRPREFRRNINLLGFDIDLVAEPVQYRWSHGDGTSSTTSRPGKPYPSMDVTYRYRDPADTVNPRVDVTYQVRYRVDSGAWATIGQTLRASGPTAALEVKEAAPVLTTP